MVSKKLTANSHVWQVYVTMYLNDAQRSPFYESLGLNTRQFDMHVIIEVGLLAVLWEEKTGCIILAQLCPPSKALRMPVSS